MNPIDVMLCTLFLVAFLGAITTPSPPKWIAVGVLFGTGLLNKYTFLVLGFSVLLSLIMTKRWEVLRSRWLYISGAVALVMFLPHLLWQINNGWPTLEFIHNATEFKNLLLSPIAFMSQLVIGLNPLTLPLWLRECCTFFSARRPKNAGSLAGLQWCLSSSICSRTRSSFMCFRCFLSCSVQGR